MFKMCQTSSSLRPALPLLMLAFFMLTMKLTCTLAIPTNNNDSNNGDLTNKTEAINKENSTNTLPIPLDIVALDKFKLSFKDDYVETKDEIHIDDKEIELCHSVTKLIYPKSAQSKNGVFVTVVQSGENKQGFWVEVCENTNESCRFAEAFPLGYTSACVQRYIYRSGVVLVNGELKEEFLKLPSSCKCVIKHNGI